MSDLVPSSQQRSLAPRAEVISPTDAAQRSGDDFLSLQTFLRLVLRRRWLILATAVTVTLLAIVQIFTTTSLYTSTATVQIDPEDPNILPYEEISTSTSAQRSTQAYLDTQAQNLQTRSLARRVVRKLELADDPVFNMPTSGGLLKDRFWGTIGTVLSWFSPATKSAGVDGVDEEGLVDRVRVSLAVRTVRGTRLLKVSYSSHDPQLSSRVLTAFLEEFIEQHLEDKYEATAKASGFLYRELQDLKVAVEKSEESLIAYARGNDVTDSDERASIHQQKLSDLSNELTKVEAELISKTALYEAVRNASVNHFPEALEDGPLRELRQRASELERQYAALSQRYGPEWPEVKRTTLEREEVERQLAAARRQAIEQAKYDYEVTRNRAAGLRQALAEQRQVVDQLNERSIQYNILKREVETNKELYEGLLQRLKEAGVAAGLRSSNIRVVDDPTLPRGASSPRRLRGMARAILLGIGLGLGLAFLLETFDNTLKSTDDVAQHVGLPALGVIPTFENGTGLAALEDEANSRSLEAYRSLRTSILLSHSGQPPQTILVSSALPGEGKTTTVTNTARVLAQTGARTLMIDLDLRRPSLGKQFRISRRTGMSTFLSGNSDLSSQIRETPVPNLYMVGAGPKAPNPAELIGSQRMTTGLKLLREHFTYIVIDSPPLLEITDALVAARQVDGVLIVAQGGRTPHEAVRKAGERLRFVGAKVLGVVLNNVNVRQLGYGYGYAGYYSEYDEYYKAALSATSGASRGRSRNGRKNV